MTVALSATRYSAIVADTFRFNEPRYAKAVAGSKKDEVFIRINERATRCGKTLQLRQFEQPFQARNDLS